MGERGVTLSGGQRQRVALARALVRRPRVLILDDATSAVDPTVEAKILGGLRRELRTTLIVVAYRNSTIALADQVVFLSGGRVEATGTHAELLATVPAYENMVTAYERSEAEIRRVAEEELEADHDAGLMADMIDRELAEETAEFGSPDYDTVSGT